MRLNQATDYAFRAVLYLSRLAPEEKAEAQSIAASEEIPMRFLLKIISLLTQAGIIKSFRGTGGGYALARLPVAITMLDVVEAVEGPICINRCLINPAYCSKKWAARCGVHRVLDVLQAQIYSELTRHNFEELAKDDQK